jgi:hypothetical protein
MNDLSSTNSICVRLRQFFLGLFRCRKVPANKELSKEEQVTSIHDEGCRIVFSFNLAIAVGVIHEIIKGHQGDGDSNNHLTNLKGRDEHRIEPLGADPHGHEGVVKVHAGVNRVVHDNEKDSRRRCGNIRMPAIEQNCNVMVPVKENKGLFVNNDEERVKEFTVGCRPRMDAK